MMVRPKLTVFSHLAWKSPLLEGSNDLRIPRVFGTMQDYAGLCSTYLPKQATLHGLGGTKAGRSFVAWYSI